MIRKTSLSKNRVKYAIIISLTVAIFALCALILSQRYDYNFFIKKFENDLGLSITNKGNYTLSLFPNIIFIQKNLSLKKNTESVSLVVRDADLKFKKKYLDWRKTEFNITSPSMILNKVPLRQVSLEAFTKNSTVNINNFNSNINEGKISLSGDLKFENELELNLEGNLKNISMTTLLNQINQIDWKRLSIKISADFDLNTKGSNEKQLIKNLNANIPIHGLFYINATPEERFGVALLNVLTEKMPGLANMSKSLDFIFTQYANIPSKIEGLIFVKNGVIETKDLLIFNDGAKMTVNMTYDITDDNIEGIVYFYRGEQVYIKARLKGSISEPQILVAGKPIKQEGDKESFEDIKKIIEEGITNIFQKLLEDSN